MTTPPVRPEPFNGEPDEEFDNDAYYEKRRRRILRMLCAAMLFVAAGLGLYALWPWLLPPFIYEGPMVQMAGEREAALVWFLSRSVDEGLTVTVDQNADVFAVTADGARCVAKLTNLTPGADHAYRILRNGRIIAEHVLHAPKAADQAFAFIAFGDSGMANTAQYMLAARMTEHDPDFILHTGDIVYPGGERRLYRARMFQPYRELLARSCFWPCIGNHDVRDLGEQSAYFDIYELPDNGPPDVPRGHDYWFDYGVARIVVIDSEHAEDALANQVAPWVRAVFSDSDALWKFAMFHRPPYTAGAHKPCESVRGTLSSVFEEVGVDLVFSGHDHLYERTLPIRNGTAAEHGPIYIVTGAGGARLYDAKPPEERPDYFAVVKNEKHSFTKVAVDGPTLTLEQIDVDGAVLDLLTLQKPARK